MTGYLPADGDKRKGMSIKTWGECVKNETSWLGTGLGTRSREVERLNMWNPSNPCMHGQRTLNDDDDVAFWQSTIIIH